MFRKLMLLTAVSLLFSMALAGPTAADAAQATSPDASTAIAAQGGSVQSTQGTIIAVRRPYGTVTFRLRDGATQVLSLARGTIVIRNGWMVNAHKLKVGDSAQATYRNGTMLGISATGP